jgi:hypothetical protein
MHNSKTDWKAFRYQIEENLQLNIPLKTAEKIEKSTTQFNEAI